MDMPTYNPKVPFTCQNHLFGNETNLWRIEFYYRLMFQITYLNCIRIHKAVSVIGNKWVVEEGRIFACLLGRGYVLAPSVLNAMKRMTKSWEIRKGLNVIFDRVYWLRHFFRNDNRLDFRGLDSHIQLILTAC